MKKTQQKISLFDEMFAKLKDYAIAVAYHSRRPTSWGDVMRMLADWAVNDCPPEKFWGWVNPEDRKERQAKEPTGEDSPKKTVFSVVIDEDTHKKLAEMAKEVSEIRGEGLSWGDLAKFMINRSLYDLDANCVAEEMDE